MSEGIEIKGTEGVTISGNRITSSTYMPYAHPMGWLIATLAGIAYGSVVGGLPYLIWRAITLSPVSTKPTLAFASVFLIGFSIPLLIEAEEHRKIRDGQAVDIRKPLRERQR